MKADNAPSIHAQIALTLIGTLAILLIGAFAVLDHLLVNRLVAAFDAGLADKARTLQTLVSWNGRQVDFDFAGEFMPEFDRHTHHAYFQLWREDGLPVEQSESLQGTALFARPPPRDQRFQAEIMLPDGKRGRASVSRFRAQWDDEVGGEPGHRTIPIGLESPPHMVVVVAADAGAIDALILAWRWRAATVMLTTLLIGIAVSRAIAGMAIARLELLAKRIATVDDDQLAARIPLDEVPLELRRVAERINQLLSRQHAVLARERNFVNDAAHELRTPIAELRVLCDVEQRWPTPGAPREGLRQVSEIAQQMERTVTALLLLARVEAGATSADLETVDVVDSLRAVIDPVRDEIGRRKLRIRLICPEYLLARVDRGMLDLALSNVVSNAVSHAPKHSRVLLCLSQSGGLATLAVINAAPELEREDVQRLFERFWRKDAARRSDGHLGLGLTLVRAVARASGWSVDASLDRRRRLHLTLGGIRLRD